MSALPPSARSTGSAGSATNALALPVGNVLHRDSRRTQSPRPERHGQPHRPRAQHLAARRQPAQPHAVERHRERLDDRPVGETGAGGQAHALVGPGQRVFGIAAALKAESGAPLDLALAAVFAMAGWYGIGTIGSRISPALEAVAMIDPPRHPSFWLPVSTPVGFQASVAE